MSRKILIVDDSRTMRSMLEMSLGSAGFEVASAEDGAQGYDVCQEVNPDLVITDINMPVMDGFELIEKIRGETNENQRVPILVLTTETHPDKRARAQNAGATGWIVKPFDPTKLISAVNRVVM